MPNPTSPIGPKLWAFLSLAGGVVLAIPFAREPTSPAPNEPVLASKSAEPTETAVDQAARNSSAKPGVPSVVRGGAVDENQPTAERSRSANDSGGFARFEPNRSTEGSSARSVFDPRFDSRSNMRESTDQFGVRSIRPPGSRPGDSLANAPANWKPNIAREETPAARSAANPAKNSTTPRLPEWARPQTSLDELIAAGPVEAGDEAKTSRDATRDSSGKVFKPMGHERRLDAAGASRLEPFQTWGSDAESTRDRLRKTSARAESHAGIDSPASDPASPWDPQRTSIDEQQPADAPPSQLASQRIVNWPDRALRIDWEQIAQREQSTAPDRAPQRGSYGASLARHDSSRYAVSGDDRPARVAPSSASRENSGDLDRNIIYRPGMRRD